MSRSFDDSLELGNNFRDLLVKKLRKDDWNVIKFDELPAANGHGPSLDDDGDIVLPDLQITKYGVTFAVEAKWKTEPTFTLITETYDFGIEHWYDYEQYERLQGIPVFLVVGHEKPHFAVYARRIAALTPRVGSAGNGTPSMMYVPLSQFRSSWLEHLNRCAISRRNGRTRREREEYD